MEMNERELVRLTGLWPRKSKRSGVEYFAGELSPTATLYLFPARDHRPGNKPSFIVYIGQTNGGGDPEEG